MNTKRMGAFIKELRNEKNISRRKLADICYLESEKAIGDWENGDSIPDIDKLGILSKFFGVSIDEILDGERRQDINFHKIYFKADNDKMMKLGLDKTIDYFTINKEQDIKIINRVNFLLEKRITDGFTSNEESEFSFLIDNFYDIDIDYCHKYASKAIKKPYILLRTAIRNLIKQTNNATKEEKIWELNKLIKQNNHIDFDLHDLKINGVPPKDSILNKRFNILSPLEKDMVLMSIQVCDPVFDEDKIGSANLKRHEELIGHAFDKNEESRNMIKYLIENGASINDFYLNFYEAHKIKKRIIDRLEKLYLLCKKPLDLYFGVGDNAKHYKAENTAKNRFIKDYQLFYDLNSEFESRDIEEWFSIFSKNESIPFQILLEYAKKNNMDTSKEDRYFMADLNQRTEWIQRAWYEFKAKEHQIEEANIEYDDLQKKLESGNTYYEIIDRKYVGGKDINEVNKYFRYWNQNVSYEEVMSSRDSNKTKELYESIDNLSLDEIRNKYFSPEEYKDECDE